MASLKLMKANEKYGQARWLSFIFINFSELGFFNGLRAKKIKKFPLGPGTADICPKRISPCGLGRSGPRRLAAPQALLHGRLSPRGRESPVRFWPVESINTMTFDL
jgi:hypothetical protein